MFVNMKAAFILFIGLLISISVFGQKENDYFVAKCENPTFGACNFQSVGLTPHNTQFMSKEWYLSKDYVKKRFSSNGYFDKSLYERFYSALSREWYRFCNFSIEKNTLIEMRKDPYNTLLPNQYKKTSINGCLFWEQPANPNNK